MFLFLILLLVLGVILNVRKLDGYKRDIFFRPSALKPEIKKYKGRKNKAPEEINEVDFENDKSVSKESVESLLINTNIEVSDEEVNKTMDEIINLSKGGDK